MVADKFAAFEQQGYLVRTGHLPQEQEAGEHGQSACPCHHKGHARAPARVGAVAPVPDEEEGGQGGHLPEDEQQEQVVGQDHAQHGTHERQQQSVQAA